MEAQYFNMPLVFNFIRVDEAYPYAAHLAPRTVRPS